jgi:hypothetical protein
VISKRKIFPLTGKLLAKSFDSRRYEYNADRGYKKCLKFSMEKLKNTRELRCSLGYYYFNGPYFISV